MAKLNQSIQRCIQIINVIARDKHLGVIEISKKTGLNKSTVHRILQTLLLEGWIYRRNIDDQFQVSENMSTLQHGLSMDLVLTQRIGPILSDALPKVDNWPLVFSTREGTRMKVLETSGQSSRIKLYEDVKDFKPHMLWSAMGRAYMANCSSMEYQQVIQQLKQSTDKHDRVVSETQWVNGVLTQTRKQGYGARDSGYTVPRMTSSSPDLSAISVPVAIEGAAIGVVTLMWATPEASYEEMVSRFLSPLEDVGKTLSVKI